MARTTKTPSYAPDIPERKNTRKTASSAKKSTANKKAEAAQLETEANKGEHYWQSCRCQEEAEPSCKESRTGTAETYHF